MIITWDTGGGLQSVEFDAVMREDPSSSTTVTEYHVERGANVADHARPELDTLTADAIVTNTPIRMMNTNTNGVTGAFQMVTIETPSHINIPRVLPGIGLAADLLKDELATTTTTGVTVLTFDGPLDRVRSVYNDLRALVENAQVVDILTSLHFYQNMVIHKMSAPRGPADGSSIQFSFSAKGIRFVDSQTVTVKADVTKKTSKGAQPPKVVDPKDKQSVLDAGGVKLGAWSKAAPGVAGFH